MLSKADELPTEVLKIAVQLRDSVRNVYIALYKLQKPSTAQEVADVMGHARAYTCMRLNELSDRGLVTKTTQGKTKIYRIKNNSTLIEAQSKE